MISPDRHRQCRARRQRQEPLWLWPRWIAPWLALLAIILHIGMAAAAGGIIHHAPEGLSDLSAAIGQNVTLCAHGGQGVGHPGLPGHDDTPCDDCPLCDLASHIDLLVPAPLSVVHRRLLPAEAPRIPVLARVVGRVIPLRGLSRAPPPTSD